MNDDDGYNIDDAPPHLSSEEASAWLSGRAAGRAEMKEMTENRDQALADCVALVEALGLPWSTTPIAEVLRRAKVMRTDADALEQAKAELAKAERELKAMKLLANEVVRAAMQDDGAPRLLARLAGQSKRLGWPLPAGWTWDTAPKPDGEGLEWTVLHNARMWEGPWPEYIRALVVERDREDPPKVDPDEPERCRRCRWPLAASIEEGCTRDNCSMRCECNGVHRDGCPLKPAPTVTGFDVGTKDAVVFTTVRVSDGAVVHEYETTAAEGTSGTRFKITTDEPIDGTDMVKPCRTITAGPCEQLDEIVVDDWLHIERMDDQEWYVRVGDARIGVQLEPGKPPSIVVDRGEG